MSTYEKPRIPPNINDLEKRFSGKLLSPAIKFVMQTESEGKYYHWDILRHLTPPRGLSHEEWWFAIKFHRMSQKKSIPLLDTKEKPFYYTIPESVALQLHQIDIGVGRDSEIPHVLENPHTRKTYLIRSLIEEAVTSSQLEGAATTRKVAKEMLRCGRKPRSKGEQMIVNNFSTMQKLREWKDYPLSIDLIFEIHKTVTNETLEQRSHIGAFRKESDSVVIEDIASREILHEPPKANELKNRMEALCSFVNGETPGHFIHPVLRAMIAHFWLAYDHPFVDGNGRIARALFYYVMLRSGYWLFEYISISEIILRGPAKYGKAFLYTETDDKEKPSSSSLYRLVRKHDEGTIWIILLIGDPWSRKGIGRLPLGKDRERKGDFNGLGDPFLFQFSLLIFFQSDLIRFFFDTDATPTCSKY